MDLPAWAASLPAAITVCDAEGRVLAMNDKAATTFAASGGRALIGQPLAGCHPPTANALLEALLSAPRANVYTVQKAGVRKLIAQLPWSDGASFGGLVELSIELPDPLPHKVRTPAG